MPYSNKDPKRDHNFDNHTFEDEGNVFRPLHTTVPPAIKTLGPKPAAPQPSPEDWGSAAFWRWLEHLGDDSGAMVLNGGYLGYNRG